MLKQKIQEDLKSFLKAKEELGSSVLRMLISSLNNREIEKRANLRRGGKLNEDEVIKEGQLSDEEIIEVITSEIRKRREAIAEFEKGKRDDLVEKEKKEMEILQKYLPEQIGEEELKNLVKEAIEKVGAKDMKDMGKVMAELMPKTRGRAEGGTISKYVKELLFP